MSRIEQIIGEIEEFIENCKNQPLSNTKIIVNKEELGELLVELRLAIPSEVQQYQKIIVNQDAIIQEARAKADSMLSDANRMTEQLVDEHEIMQKAYATANKLIEDANMQAQGIVDDATNEANAIRTSAIKYTDDMLSDLQTIITHGLENAHSKYEAYAQALQQSYDVVTSNRAELSGGSSTATEA